jgi:signal transduction histidine kinase
MKSLTWPRDTIARRFAITIIMAALVTVGLKTLYESIAGVWGLPPIEETSLLDQAVITIKLIEAAPQQTRAKLAVAADIDDANVRIRWYADKSQIPPLPITAKELAVRQDIVNRLAGDKSRNISVVKSADSIISDTYFMNVELDDKSWLVFTVFHRSWGLRPATHFGITLAMLMTSITIISFIASRRLARPIEQFAEAVRRFGANPRAPSIDEVGPQELRVAIKAFNAMQAQIQKFVADRTAMLTAISHDLRTPLTRMRLRGEFIDDTEQQTKLFHDVDEMHAMIDSALEFFRDDAQIEETTHFDLSELMRTIRDDYADQGIDIIYRGADHQVYLGRPRDLKRAFTNLINNAVKYGTPPEIELTNLEKAISVIVKDRGPGIPQESLEQVFTPFYRLEGSRNRTTGGVGLGLTVVRTIVRSHGGDIVLNNRSEGGLEAVIMLPLSRLRTH